MKKSLNYKLLLLAAATSLSLGATATYAETTASEKVETKMERDADGNYVKKTTTESKDAAGTKTIGNSEIKVKADADGSYKKTVESKSSSDPDGLMNKSQVTSKDSVKSDDDEYTEEHSMVTKNGDTGTKTTSKGKIEVKADDEGNIEKTVETKTTNDPKGLMNKKSTKSVEKMEQKNGENNYRYTKEVDGKTVEDKTIKSN